VAKKILEERKNKNISLYRGARGIRIEKIDYEEMRKKWFTLSGSESRCGNGNRECGGDGEARDTLGGIVEIPLWGGPVRTLWEGAGIDKLEADLAKA